MPVHRASDSRRAICLPGSLPLPSVQPGTILRRWVYMTGNNRMRTGRHQTRPLAVYAARIISNRSIPG
jgi:hypothetical protein